MKEKVSFTLDGKEYSFNQDTELLGQLFWSLGATLAEIQSFETGLIFLLGGIKSQKKNVTLKDIYEKDESKTLGVLISELMRYIKREEFRDLLKIIRDDRNYIVHGILRKYGWPVISELQYQNLIKEILEIRDFIHKSEPLLKEYIKKEKLLELFDIELIYEKVMN